MLPLRVFSERYQSTLVQLAGSDAPNANKKGMCPEILMVNLFPVFFDVQIEILGRILAWTGLIKSHAPLLRRQYGLLVNVSKSDSGSPTGALTIEAEKQAPVDEDADSDGSHQPYHYELFPDWHASYLWYDAMAENYHGDQAVEDYTLDARYPGLAPLYWAWQEAYEEAFEKQGLNLGYDGDVFQDLEDRLAWEVTGFLIATWLAFQDNVESIDYSPSMTSNYHIRGENTGEFIRQFLKDENALLCSVVISQ